MTESEAVLNLVRELWEQSSPAHRCPHVSYTGTNCRCAAVDERSAELVCDTASLQLWCLDGERYPTCHFYPKQGGVMNKCIDCGTDLDPEPEVDDGKLPKGVASCRAWREWVKQELAAGSFDLGARGTPEMTLAAMDLLVQQCDARREVNRIAASN
jgi:hypothetical protein